jgi:hypothetical protein
MDGHDGTKRQFLTYYEMRVKIMLFAEWEELLLRLDRYYAWDYFPSAAFIVNLRL